MPKNTDPGFEKLPLAHEIAAEVWNAQNGVMLTYGVGKLARLAYAKASKVTDENGVETRIDTSVGSTKSLLAARNVSVGLNAAALHVIDALNGWDDRSRERIVKTPGLGVTREWQGKFRFSEMGLRERAGLAAHFAIEPFTLVLPDKRIVLADTLRLTVQQPHPASMRTSTHMDINGGEVVFGVQTDGTILQDAFVRYPEIGVMVGDERDLTVAALGGMLRHLERSVRAETAR